jgi:tetratricopeptide (TPR) repeat protein
MLARFEEAAPIAIEAGQRWRELTGDDWVDSLLCRIATTVGDHESAAVQLRRFCDLAEARGQRYFLSTYAPMLGRSLCLLGRYKEAEPLAQLGRELDESGQDVLTQSLWRQVQALVHASRGQYAEAETLARRAVAIMERTDALNQQGDALCDLAEVLHAAGQADEAAAPFGQALERYEGKHNFAQAAQVRDRLAALQEAAQR